jgi:glycosyltransferase involved in cell wall biosynthesis
LESAIEAFGSSLAWQSDELFYARNIFGILDEFVVLSRSDKALWNIFDIQATYLPNPPPFEIGSVARATLKHEVVLWIGRVSAEKRVFDALEIFSRVAQALPGAKLMIVGRGDTDAELDAVAAQIKELAIQDSVEICGYSKDTSEFYERASFIFLRPRTNRFQ